MHKNRYQHILYFIATVIVITLGIQIYWNFKNYEAGKRQLINEVQISLDNAVDQYYEELAKNQTIGFASNSGGIDTLLQSNMFDKILKDIDTAKSRFSNLNFLDSTKIKGVSIFRGKEVDSIEHHIKKLEVTSSSNFNFNVNVNTTDTAIVATQNPIEVLTSKIVISINQEDIKLKEIDSLLKNELLRKRVSIDYAMLYTDPHKVEKKLDLLASSKNSLSTLSKSSYLPSNSTLELFFTNTTKTILQKNLIGILLSFLLVSAVISCLLYLLKIINHQKQLAELKNDLISNITHEFKTPIATISAALEAIQNFNQENDPIKTQKYVSMSSTQVGKLNTMVEKILETATLDSDKLQLKLEEVNLVALINSIINRHQIHTPEKNISLHSILENIWIQADVFHIENAINNIIDNAIKYGGDSIQISIKKEGDIKIEIIDNGTSLTKAQKDKIFEKFYRVPKGNTHDVKGFGIGLFYTKTIIEKHQGSIQLLLNNQHTNFKITLPNG